MARALGSALVLFAPVVLPAGLGDSWDLLIRYPIEDFSEYQSLPFPLLYHGPARLGGPRRRDNTVGSVLIVEVPLLLVIDLAACWSCWRCASGASAGATSRWPCSGWAWRTTS